MSADKPSKGYISFRTSARSVAFVLIRYGCKNQTLRSYKYEELEAKSSEISSLLSSVPGSVARWETFCIDKLPDLMHEHLTKKKTLSYKQIENMLNGIVFTLEQSKRLDKKGARGGVELAIKFWGAWQLIRPVISSSAYWNVKEDDALVALGIKPKKAEPLS